MHVLWHMMVAGYTEQLKVKIIQINHSLFLEFEIFTFYYSNY